MNSNVEAAPDTLAEEVQSPAWAKACTLASDVAVGDSTFSDRSTHADLMLNRIWASLLLWVTQPNMTNRIGANQLLRTPTPLKVVPPSVRPPNQ